MGMTILFTRHGESEANVQRVISNRDLPHQLTAVGLSQSLALAKTLTKWNVQRVIASPIARARETGNIIAEELGVPLSISPALSEFDCGMLEGRSDEGAWRAHKAVTRSWDEDQDYDSRIMPDGESFNDMKTRFLPFLMKIIGEKGQQRDVLLVSHGGILHQMLPLITTNLDRVFTNNHPLGNCELVVTMPVNYSSLLCTAWGGIEMQ